MYSMIENMDIRYIICLGDIYDQFSQSRFPKPVIITPKEETEISRVMAEELWWKLNKMFPKAKKFLLSGNHDGERIKKKVISTIPEIFHFVDYKSIFEFKNVETIHDYRDDLYIEGTYFLHGVYTKEGAHIAKYQDNVVFAHTHRAWISKVPLKNKVITEFCCGYLGDPLHPFLSYTKLKNISEWVKGFGLIDYLGPRFISL